MLLKHHESQVLGVSRPAQQLEPTANVTVTAAQSTAAPSEINDNDIDEEDDEDPLEAAAMMAPLRRMLTTVETARLNDSRPSKRKRLSVGEAGPIPSRVDEDPLTRGLVSEETGRRLFHGLSASIRVTLTTKLHGHGAAIRSRLRSQCRYLG